MTLLICVLYRTWTVWLPELSAPDLPLVVREEGIRAKGVAADRLAEISNWATGVLSTTRGDGNRMRAELGLRESFVIVYSGNLGVSHEFETLLQAVSLVRERLPRLRLVIFGDGVRLVEVRRLTRDLRLVQVVTFVPPVPAERLPESLGRADLGIVSLREGFEGLVVPSKLLGYMARAIPVLYIGPESDASQLVARHACGYCVRNGDASAAAGAIVHACENPERLDAMGRAARQAYETGMTREQSLAGYESVIRQSLHAYGGQAHS